ncbi:MAG TPA: alpha/beta hydrolase [Chloroflexota bacterium]|jgi:pimeloyl-ACP methyl ester carboxylesterase|nr:alpha/beta hydrolase [Chloroflexota bacterium]
MPVFERQDIAIYYEEHGEGFPLLLLSPGGLNSTIGFWSRLPFNPVEIFPSEFRVIAMDQRNAGRSSGPLPIDDPWGGYADDQLGLMDHLGIDRFLTMGCCIGCSFILKLVERAPDRVVAGVMEQPIGEDHTNPGFFGPRMYTEWGHELSGRRPDITTDNVSTFGERMFAGEFVFSVPRAFLSTVQTPLLVMPGNDPAHPTGVGLEVAQLLPGAELLENWKAPPEIVPQTIETVRAFLKSHSPELMKR